MREREGGIGRKGEMRREERGKEERREREGGRKGPG